MCTPTNQICPNHIDFFNSRGLVISLLLLYQGLFFAQQSRDFTLDTAFAQLAIDPINQKVSGSIRYAFRVLRPNKTMRIDAKNMKIDSVKQNQKIVKYTYDQKKIGIQLPKATDRKHQITIFYEAYPQKAMYFFIDKTGDSQVWTQGQGKYTSNWLPSFDDVNQKAIFNFNICAPKGPEVIANGKLKQVSPIGEDMLQWEYRMQQPMSSYLVAVVLGKYAKKELRTAKGIPLLQYYYPSDSSYVAATYRHGRQIFDFLEKEIGYNYPWQNYKQVPVKDFLYAGMENTGTTLFSDSFMTDETAFIDRNYIDVHAHELAHQWFGNLVTATESTHHWLQEGFATYYAWLAQRKLFGSDYFHFKLYQSADQLTQVSASGKGTALLDPNASSLTFYERGAWVLYALRNTIGDHNFRTAIRDYLKTFAFKSAATDDFFKIVERVSGKSLSNFRKVWLEAVAFPAKEALKLLIQNSFIKKYLNLASQRNQPLAGKWELIHRQFLRPRNSYLAQEAVYQLQGSKSPEAIAAYKTALDTEDILVRQAIANTLISVPEALKSNYESLLKDPSYATIEAALFHLWNSFPLDRKRYLRATREMVGFSDKNIRNLWLVLSLQTSDYSDQQRQQWLQELSGYTSDRYHFRCRQLAFRYLDALQTFLPETLKHLLSGAMHHQWRFRNTCRELLDRLWKQEQHKKILLKIKPELPKKQQIFLNNRYK